jgi:hypothetical protein
MARVNQGAERMDTQELLVKRLDDLVAQADDLLRRQYQSDVWHFVPAEGYFKWRSQSLVLLASLGSVAEIYKTEFEVEVNDSVPSRVEKGKGILTGIRDDAVNGYLTSYRSLVTAEVWTDFLEMATHLVEHGYKEAATSLTGAVLENGFRELLAKAGEPPKQRGNLQALSLIAYQKKLVTPLEHKTAQAWIALRDHADHGDFANVDTGEVRRMIDGVTAFLSRH